MNYSDFIYDFNLYLCERFGLQKLLFRHTQRQRQFVFLSM